MLKTEAKYRIHPYLGVLHQEDNELFSSQNNLHTNRAFVSFTLINMETNSLAPSSHI